jgi:hypothetical protein
MSSASLHTGHQRLFLGGLPLLVLGAAAFLIAPKVGEIRRLQRETVALEQEAASTTAIAPLSAPGTSDQKPTAPRGAPPAARGEQHAFLEDLNTLTTKSNVRLVAFRPPASRNGTPPASSGQEASLLLPRIAEITVEGAYGDLMAFFQALERSERLQVPETLHITAPHYPRLTATLRLMRFVIRAPARTS